LATKSTLVTGMTSERNQHAKAAKG